MTSGCFVLTDKLIGNVNVLQLDQPFSWILI